MKFSIVTPTHNSEAFLAESIESVISQKGDFQIEYLIMDNCSTDGTLSIAEEYQKSIQSGVRKIHCREIQIKLVSEPDLGMYDAINKGFSRATGDVCAWINSDDIYLPGAFSIVHQSLNAYPQIKWIKGITSYMNEISTIYSAGTCNLYNQKWIKDGVYGPVLYFIQQDSVFWRSSLWNEVKDEVARYSLAGDYFIWIRFAQHYPLYSLNAYVSCFRLVAGQKSEAIEDYWHDALKATEINQGLLGRMRMCQRIQAYLPKIVYAIIWKLMFGDPKGFLVSPAKSCEPVLCEGSLNELKGKIL